ncbi:MAG: outer membrane beta-barrel protein [Gammaproteobacteria bacterium]|nr:outer membrane beta-barrel protein [Gammaproteobacteria bacterium]
MRHFINIALVLAFSAAAQAQLPDLTYNAFSAGFTRTDVDHATEDADSLTVGLSYEINETFHLWGQLDRTTLDQAIEFPFFTDDVVVDHPGIGLPPVETKVRSLGLAVGGGFHNDLTDSLSGYARLGFVYADTEVEVSTFGTVFEGTGVTFGGDGLTTTESSTDFVLSAGLRYKAVDWLDLFGGLSQVGEDSTTGHAGAEFWIANGWGAQLAGVLGDNSQGFSLGVVRRF